MSRSRRKCGLCPKWGQGWCSHRAEIRPPDTPACDFGLHEMNKKYLRDYYAKRRKKAISQPSGHGAKMREALVNISKYADCAAMRQHDATTQHYIEQIRKWAEAALAEPRRNCDVGTVEEQCVRYSRFCRQHAPCDNGNCPLRVAYDCKFTWAQMPYKEGGKACT